MPDKSKEGGRTRPAQQLLMVRGAAGPDGRESGRRRGWEGEAGAESGKAKAGKKAAAAGSRQQLVAKQHLKLRKKRKEKEKARRDLSTRRGRAAAGGGQERTQRASMIASVLSAGAGRSWESEKGERRAGVEPKGQRHRKRDVGTGPGEARGDSDRPVQSRWWWWPGTHATATQAAQDAGTALAGWRH